MIKKPKLSKIFIVVFLTILIWVWADLAQDEALVLRNFVTITASRSTEQLWMTFAPTDEPLQSTVTLTTVELTGPASRVADIRRLQNEGELKLDLFLDPEQVGLTGSDTRAFDVLNFLKQNEEIRRLGLAVESCEPRNLPIQVRTLVRKTLRVECLDQNRNVITNAEIEPETVEAFVPDDAEYVARVQLTSAEQQRATSGPVSKKPTVEFAPGQAREVDTTIEVTLPSQAVALKSYSMQANLGYVFSPILQGKYRVVLDPNQGADAELPSVTINATEAARIAYGNETFKVFLNILDEDVDQTDWIPRSVEFNFPDEFVRRREIEVGDVQPLPIRFRLEAIVPAPETTPLIESGL